ncbi:MAG: CDP-diacylglycerol--serine O-phosphatidyltransferase [Acidobacteria bacterium]|nr:CDP-diacylglycerol--serine O-phosphatidyltransferase [Acidobacteriota bacterium]
MNNTKKISQRGIYILPALLTTGNMFCGFTAITYIWAASLARMTGDMTFTMANLNRAAIAIGIAIVLDALDGRIARLMGATSQFGVHLDSLADAVSFGIAPALLMWGWGLSDIKHFGWIACFIFLICGVMRLARFNVQSGELKHFVGLPIPAAAGIIAAFAHFAFKYKQLPLFSAPLFPYLLLGIGFLLGISMVSTLRYISFKSLTLRTGKSHFNIVLIALFIAGVWFFSHEMLLILSVAYFLGGIAGTIRHKFWPRTNHPLPGEEEENAVENAS